MKTEALRAIANDLKYNTGLIHSNIQLLTEESFISGVKYGQSSPKIKQLEWERNGTIWHVNQYNPVGYTAAITKWAFGEKQYSVRLGLNDSRGIKIFNSLEEAKDFVQQDFEKRVKECLITE